MPYLTLTAEHHFLVVDKGSADGVQVGNTFTMLRPGDTTQQRVLELDLPSNKKKEPALPMESVALCMVTEVKERTSNCVLTHSIQEVAPGATRGDARRRAAPPPSADAANHASPHLQGTCRLTIASPVFMCPAPIPSDPSSI